MPVFEAGKSAEVRGQHKSRCSVGISRTPELRGSPYPRTSAPLMKNILLATAAEALAAKIALGFVSYHHVLLTLIVDRSRRDRPVPLASGGVPRH